MDFLLLPLDQPYILTGSLKCAWIDTMFLKRSSDLECDEFLCDQELEVHRR